VEYGKLLDIGREAVAAQVGRSLPDSFVRATLQRLLTRPALFRLLVSLGRAVRGLLPHSLRVQLPDSTPPIARPPARHPRRMLLLEGCVQPALRPGINDATARVLDRIGISVVDAPKAGCCGALAHHLGDTPAGREAARRNVDAWIAALDAGAEAIVTTASGCGVAVKDYGWLLREDARYAEKARRVAAAARDVSEVLAAERAALGALIRPGIRPAQARIAWHPPCTLQHGQKLTGVVEPLLVGAGFELTPVPESHLCCGSAGTYSLLQPKIAGDLRARKLRGLLSGAPERIVTANIGCLTHLQAASEVPVLHWVELLDRTLTSEGTRDATRAMPERQ
jgi:glycolate oxidase iron-sulfur subunit